MGKNSVFYTCRVPEELDKKVQKAMDALNYEERSSFLRYSAEVTANRINGKRKR